MVAVTALAGRVLIRPQANPTTTDSGLHLAEHYKPEQRGTVVAIGPLRCDRCQAACPPDFQVGDSVLFSWTVGQELLFTHHDERLLVMRVEDILAVVEVTS